MAARRKRSSLVARLPNAQNEFGRVLLWLVIALILILTGVLVMDAVWHTPITGRQQRFGVICVICGASSTASHRDRFPPE